jgi:hypothetical protein
MKLAVLSVLKNEEDVLPSWLKFMDFADYFLFRNNESMDRSGDIVKNFHKTVYYENISGRFETRMWDRLIEESQKYLTENDWFMIWAPDLFPFFSVKQEIAKAERARNNCLCSYYPTFFFTKEMYKKYNTEEEFRKKISNFDIKNFLFFRNSSNYVPCILKNVKIRGQRIRYTESKQEPPPIPNISVYHNSLITGHYRFRSPKQMKIRMYDRRQANPQKKGKLSFTHYPTWEWIDYLISEKLLHAYSSNESMKRCMDLVRLDKLVMENKKL